MKKAKIVLTKLFIYRYVLMNAGDPLNETEAEEMMKEADEDGTIGYENIATYWK